MPSVVRPPSPPSPGYSETSQWSLGEPVMMRPQHHHQQHRASIASSNGYSSSGWEETGSTGGPAGGGTYQLEHLATFTVSPPVGIVFPADGMRRLLQLEKSNGIWSQKMQMRMDRRWLIIMDFESGDVMERFPVSLIREPTAFTSSDPGELYNNILVFIVAEEGPTPGGSKVRNPAEMHIFQCYHVSAQELVEELKMAMAGRLPQPPGGPSSSSSSAPNRIPPPPEDSPPHPPHHNGSQPSTSSAVNVRQQASIFESHAPHGARGEQDMGRGHLRRGGGGSPDLMPPAPGHHSDAAGEEDDRASSTCSDKYERDVAVLNRCFDDIERFIARLQHAAAAFQELERRRKTRKSKKKDHGDGMLSMRAKAPGEREFIDILQKFKLSFNLLAKLKTHIHDPNAPELVHFLFTPLALIVDAARDSHPVANLPPKVVAPLMTREALDLLLNCLTSKETELWHSLGPAWLHARDQWNSYVPQYQPVFLDGWSPDFPVMGEERDRAGVLGTAVASEAKRTRGDEIRAAQHEAELREKQYHHRGERDEFFDLDRQDSSPEGRRYGYDNRNYSSRHEMRRDRYDRERSHTPVSEQQHHPHPRDSRSDISADSIEHFGDGHPGHGHPGPSQPSPHQRAFERSQRQWLEELKMSGCKVVQVTYPRTANNDKELTVMRGEYLHVLDDSRKWWKARNQRGQVAHVPHTIVSPQYAPDHDAVGFPQRDRFSQDNSRDADGSEIGGGGGNGGGARGGPPRSPIPPPASAEWIRKERQGRKARNEPDDDSDELDESDEVDDDSDQNKVVSQPPRPPPLPPPSPPSSTPTSTLGGGSKSSPTSRKGRANGPERGEDAEMVQQELKYVLSMYRKKPALEIPRTPDVYIAQRSSTEDVQEWLRQKSFGTRVCSQLRGMNGEEILALSRQQLEQYFGKEEGHRLYSQLTLQRNACGYKTARSSELRAILAKARVKAEGPSPSPPARQNSHSSSSASDENLEDVESTGSAGGLSEQLRRQRELMGKRTATVPST